MQNTSFGKMMKIVNHQEEEAAELLIFEKKGRKHMHKEFESFAVLSGSGQIVSGETTHEVRPGDVVTIPPKTFHWMIPNDGEVLTGLLWYHDAPGKHLS